MNADLFTHAMVETPVYHGVDLRVPAELGNQRLARLGYVDVTAAPFNADPSGKTDSTQAIQNAVDFARDHQMVCFLPAGDYLVTDTIKCAQGYYYWRKDKVGAARHHPCMMVGSSKDPSKRARIVLAPKCPGYNDPENPKHVVKFWARACRPKVKGDWSSLLLFPDEEQPNISFNQLFMNIDISIGEGNAGAIGIYLRAAQGSGVINSTIDARHGFAGLEGGAGSGGSHFSVTVQGGRIGLDLTGAQPAPVVGGITLIGQTECALRYSGVNTLTAVGLTIHPADGAAAIQCGTVDSHDPFAGHISLIDSRIEYDRWNEKIPAIDSCKNLYLENVYIKNAATAVAFEGKEIVAGKRDTWTCMRTLVQCARPRQHPKDQSIEYTFPIYVSGSTRDPIIEVTEQAPPSDLCSRHLWTGELPTFETAGVVNVKDAPYNAHGDGIADDSDALQLAIDENVTLFLPKGHYLVSRPLKLRKNSRIVGVSQILSNILIQQPGEHFGDASRPQAVVETPNVRDGSNLLAFFSTTVPRSLLGAYAFRHQAAQAIILGCRFGFHHQADDEENRVRDLEHSGSLQPGVMNHALVVVSGSGGGKWYMHYEEQPILGHSYRHLLIEGTSEPLAFYHLNIEHAGGDAQMEIRQSRNVRIYSFKTERNPVAMRIHSCEDISVYGWGGNATPFPGKSLIEIIHSHDVRLVNLVDLGRMDGKGYDDLFGKGDHPSLWTMIRVDSESESYTAKPCERPAYFSV